MVSKRLRPANVNGDKAPQVPLPKSLVQALPASSTVMKHVAAIVGLIPQLRAEMEASEKRGAIDLARSFVVLHRLREVLLSEEKNWFKPLSGLFNEYNVVKCPSIFETAGVTHMPLAEGYRVGVNYTWRASVKPDVRQDAFTWMKANYPDVISETINASTLSALCKNLNEEQNEELPADLFNAAHLPSMSVTKT